MRNYVLIVIFVCSFFYLRLMKTGAAQEPGTELTKSAPVVEQTARHPDIEWLFALSVLSMTASAGIAIAAFVFHRTRRPKPVLIIEDANGCWTLTNIGAAPAINVGIVLESEGHARPQAITCTTALLAGEGIALDWLNAMNVSDEILAVQYSDSRNARFYARLEDGQMRYESRWPHGDLRLLQKPALFLYRDAA